MHRNRSTLLLLLVVLGCSCLSSAQEPSAFAAQFRLQDGSAVVFFGDSITEQKLYTSDIENYVVTRFPDRRIRFIHSGVGGDKVSGGWAGPIDLRLARDVFAYHPSMVTVMLGMNDGYYRPSDPGIESTYEDGYRHLVAQMQAALPQSTLTLLKPSPYDDVTRDPDVGAGYNTSMQSFGDFVGKLAEQRHTLVADLNRPVTAVLAAAKAVDAPMSTTLMRDRVHPGKGIHWIMAEAVLQAWGAPSIVTSATIDAVHLKAAGAVNTEVSQILRAKYGLMWTQNDRALPLPLPSSESDPFVALVLRVSDIDRSLNQEPLRVEGLAEGSYELRIDDRAIGTFSAAQLAAGIDLANLDTPMLAQSRLVAWETWQKNEIDNIRFMIAYDARDAKATEAIKKLDAAIDLAIERRRKDAQPVPHHHYSLLRAVQATEK
jgi:lysophospholipase L1-like esterase